MGEHQDKLMDKQTKENWAKVKAALETANKTDLTGATNYGSIDVLGTFTSSGIDNTKGSTVTYERKDFSFS